MLLTKRTQTISYLGIGMIRKQYGALSWGECVSVGETREGVRPPTYKEIAFIASVYLHYQGIGGLINPIMDERRFWTSDTTEMHRVICVVDWKKRIYKRYIINNDHYDGVNSAVYVRDL